MAARQDDDDRVVMVSSSEPKSDNRAYHEGNGEPCSSNATRFENLCKQVIMSKCLSFIKKVIHICKQVIMSKCLSFIKKFIEEKVSFPHVGNDVLVILCVIANMLDPLFCYILVVDQHKSCVGFDKKLKLMIVVLRSVIDFVYILLVVFQFCKGHSESAGENNGGFLSIIKRYLLSSLVVDILAVLPLPQVVVLVVFQATKWSHLPIAITTLKLVLVFQLLPRVFRVYSFLKEARWSSGIFSNSAVTKALFNLFLYVVASHGFGAFWYLFSIERKATCLQRCHSRPYCPHNYNSSSIERLCMDGCSGKTSSSDIAAFDFGIFGDAFNSGVVYSTDFIWKFSYCCWWGLQNLSSLGQGLKSSSYIWEIYFAASLTVSGLVLFALLIGNLQTILQAKAARHEEMRLKGEKIKLWMTYQKLPLDLRQQIKQYEEKKWQKTRGVDIAEIFDSLPRHLRVRTTRHFCYDAIKKVEMFQCAGEKLWNAICVCLKPILHTAHNSIISKGDPLEEVIFISKGKLWMYSNSNSNWDELVGEELKEGDYFGEDLIKHAIQHPHLLTFPISTKTISACTEVEAFVLSARDLKIVINKYWWHFSQRLRKDPSYNERRKDANYKEPWATLAAGVLQTKWHRIYINKTENSQPPATKKFNLDNLQKVLGGKQSKKKSKRCKDNQGPSDNNV